MALSTTSLKYLPMFLFSLSVCFFYLVSNISPTAHFFKNTRLQIVDQPEFHLRHGSFFRQKPGIPFSRVIGTPDHHQVILNAWEQINGSCSPFQDCLCVFSLMDAVNGQFHIPGGEKGVFIMPALPKNHQKLTPVPHLAFLFSLKLLPERFYVFLRLPDNSQCDLKRDRTAKQLLQTMRPGREGLCIALSDPQDFPEFFRFMMEADDA